MYRPGILEIQQSGCAALTIAAAVSWRSPDTLGQGAGKPENYIDVPWSRTFHLLPPEKGEDRFPPTVEWTENSLSFRSRFIAAGFGAGWGHNAMVFTLEWKDAETLLYSFRHEKGRRGKKYMDIQCELKRVDGDGDAG